MNAVPGALRRGGDRRCKTSDIGLNEEISEKAMADAGTGKPFATGFGLHPGWFDRAGQNDLVAALKTAVAAAPFFTSDHAAHRKAFLGADDQSLGPFGWVSDKDGGYRYQPVHPQTGNPWPPIPDIVMDVWNAVAGLPASASRGLPRQLLRGRDESMGLHHDADEADFSAPCCLDLARRHLSVPRRRDDARGPPVAALSSGDDVVPGGASRLAFHGVDRVYPGTSKLLGDWFPEGGRLNLTLRRVTRAND